MAVGSHGPGIDFVYVCTVTLTLEICPCINVITLPLVMGNSCVKYYPDPIWQLGVVVPTRIWSMYALWHWPLEFDIGSRSWHTRGLGQQLCKILSRSNFAVRSYGLDTDFEYVCSVTLTLEIWPWVNTLLGHGQQVCEIHVLSRSNMAERSNVWPRHGLWVCVHCYVDLGNVTLGHGQQLCEI